MLASTVEGLWPPLAIICGNRVFRRGCDRMFGTSLRRVAGSRPPDALDVLVNRRRLG
jgi:hypothetical protein